MSTGAGASDLLHAEDPGLDAMVRGETAVAARSPLQLFWRRFRRDKVAMVALAFIVLLILVAIFAARSPSCSARPRRTFSRRAALDDFGLPEGPSSEHFFGVDPIGRDVFSRVLYGAQVSLTVAFIGTGLSVILGVILGVVAGFYRGWSDTLIARSLDVMLAFPVLLLGLGLATACSGENGCAGGLIQPGLSVVIFIIVIANTPYVARIIRGQVLSLREKEFVEASRSLGASNSRIMFRDIVPNLVAPIIVYATLFIPANILLEAALSFLGVGVQPPRASWGAMLSDAVSIFDMRLVVHVLPGDGAAADRAGLQPRRRRPAGRAQPQGHEVLVTQAFSSSESGSSSEQLMKGRYMRRSFQWTLILGVLLALTLGVAACGGDDKTAGSGEQNTDSGTPAEGKKGGKLTVLWTDDVDNIDPGITYYQMGFAVNEATHRPLYGYEADDARQRRSGPRRVRPGDLGGRQDRHGQDQGRASSSRPRSIARSRRRTSSTRSSAASSTP